MYDLENKAPEGFTDELKLVLWSDMSDRRFRSRSISPLILLSSAVLFLFSPSCTSTSLVFGCRLTSRLPSNIEKELEAK